MEFTMSQRLRRLALLPGRRLLALRIDPKDRKKGKWGICPFPRKVIPSFAKHDFKDQMIVVVWLGQPDKWKMDCIFCQLDRPMLVYRPHG